MYEVIQVPDDAAELSEQMGTKFKFWYASPIWGQTLFKEGRPGTGENWAEVLASRLASALALPHAHYELAHYRDREGVVSPSLVPEGGRLIHGNELLSSSGHLTAGVATYRQRTHTLRRVLGFLMSAQGVEPPVGFVATTEISSALDVFVGYLMFDAWIANQDRHEENWALIRGVDERLSLAASYDHGSSMGRNESDANRDERLKTADSRRHITAYVERARSAFYPTGADEKTKSLLTIQAFESAAKLAPRAARGWRDKLEHCTEDDVQALVNGLPTGWTSPVAKEFTAQLLMLNRKRILGLEL